MAARAAPPATDGRTLARPVSAAPILSARDLAIAPPGVAEPIARGLSLDLHPGELVVLAGANGSGKSTLALTLAGLLAPRAGDVRFEGAPFGPDAPPHHRAGVSVVLQDPSNQLLQPTVWEEVAFAAVNLALPDPDAAAARVIAALGLEDEIARDPRTLSAGRQQLVLLAAALVTDPRLLVLDEPLVHVDPQRRARARAVIAAARGRGMAVVWAGAEPGATHTLTLGAAGDRAGARIGAGRYPAGPAAGADPVRGADQVPGSDPARDVDPATAGADSEPPALVLEVAADDHPADGPRVITSTPFSISVPARGVVALTGPNGAGKSVLLAAAAGILATPQISVRRVHSPTAPPILTSQHPDEQLFEERVGDELIYAAVARGVPQAQARQRACGTLEAACLPSETSARRTWTLSGGEKRIVVALAALMAPAGFVALDEPTAGLDPARRIALAEAISRVSNEIPVLIATQDVDFARSIGARIVALPGGASDRPEGVEETPSPSKKTD